MSRWWTGRRFGGVGFVVMAPARRVIARAENPADAYRAWSEDCARPDTAADQSAIFVVGDDGYLRVPSAEERAALGAERDRGAAAAHDAIEADVEGRMRPDEVQARRAAWRFETAAE